jgi:hypothetical protein
MVYISKVYTKFGDGGDTMLASGDTVGKDTLRVAAYGEVDELNSVLGLLRVEVSRAKPSAFEDAPSSRPRRSPSPASSKSSSTSEPSSPSPAPHPARPASASSTAT